MPKAKSTYLNRISDSKVNPYNIFGQLNRRCCVKMAEIHIRSLILLIFLYFNFVYGNPKLSDITWNKEKVVFVYPSDVVSERDLTVCQERSACNIIYKRFWLPPMVERLCRCPNFECSWIWSPKQDNYTMFLDNRSQLKFCNSVSQLPKCGQKKPALITSTQKQSKEERQPNNYSLQYSIKNGPKPIRGREPTNVTVSCNCPHPHYWKIKPNATKSDPEHNQLHETYYCAKLKKCKRAEFCGYVRADLFSTYYRCSCLRGHLCISKDKTIFNAEELLYNGVSYKAHCFPHEKT